MVDDITWGELAAIPDTSILSRRVVCELTTRIECRGNPGMIVLDNSAVLILNTILKGCAEHKVEWCDIASADSSALQANREMGQVDAERLCRNLQRQAAG